MTFIPAILTDHGTVVRRTRGASAVVSFENSNLTNNQKQEAAETLSDSVENPSTTKDDG